MAIPAETKFHVLVVDDSLIDRKLIERLLKTSSCQVTVVDLGSKALEFLGIHGEQGTSPSGSSECQLSMKEYFQAFPDGKLQRTFGMIWDRTWSSINIQLSSQLRFHPSDSLWDNDPMDVLVLMQVFPGAWTAVLVSLDNVGVWNIRAENLDTWYLGQEVYVKIVNPEKTNKTELPMLDNALFCGALPHLQKPQHHSASSIVAGRAKLFTPALLLATISILF